MNTPPSDGGSESPTEPLTLTSQPPASGESISIGPYRLVQKVGEGGMGEVWQAEQTQPLRRKVALKIIKQGMDTKAVIARFEQERQALALMDHPNVARVFDAGTTPEGRPYFVMEYVHGLPITEHCDRHRLTTSERLALFEQVCEGVQHAHMKAILHRDLKPSNVLVTLQGDKATAKIIDFGVAKATAQRLTEASLFTELGVLVGTPEYMSPEQADLTSQDVDTRTDVYSLGVMLYELLVGALPFESRDLRKAGLENIRQMIREVEPAKPSQRLGTLGDERSTESARRRRVDVPSLRKLLRGELDWITMKAMEKDRARRYGSPAELSADIGRHLRNEPVLAGPPSAAYRARKFVRRHRLGVIAATLGVLVPIAFALAMAAEARRTAREAESKARVAEFLQELFKVSNPSEARGNSITARELLDRSAEKIGGSLTEDPRVRADLMQVMGNVYMNLGLYSRAEPLLKESLEARRRLLGEEDPGTLSAAHDMALLLDQAGRSEEAEALNRKVLEARTRALGPDDPETLKSMNNLATSYGRQERFEEAEALHRQVLAARQRILGPDHPSTVKVMLNLASDCSSQGRPDEAERLSRQALEINRRILGEDHPDTLIAMVSLANSVTRQGRYKEAEPLYRKGLEISRRVNGPDHPDTLRWTNNLANDLVSQESYQEAEALYAQVVEVSRRDLGPTHPTTLRAIYNLACSAALRGDRAAAIGYLREPVEGGWATRRKLEEDEDLASLRGDREFQALVARAKEDH
ncbi:MAG TPA: serine/threonine-protein kinase [Candidatus Polarisedimenticolia bacterium]|nr:serine/threonine-protein kinase [Candidatus Polarisedimenticolia bacterium]